jgi:hypothetical protein
MPMKMEEEKNWKCREKQTEPDYFAQARVQNKFYAQITPCFRTYVRVYTQRNTNTEHTQQKQWKGKERVTLTCKEELWSQAWLANAARRTDGV